MYRWGAPTGGYPTGIADALPAPDTGAKEHPRWLWAVEGPATGKYPAPRPHRRPEGAIKREGGGGMKLLVRLRAKTAPRMGSGREQASTGSRREEQALGP